jgi:hypothetical protein
MTKGQRQKNKAEIAVTLYFIFLILLSHSNLDVQRAVFRFAQKTPFNKIYRGEHVFE